MKPVPRHNVTREQPVEAIVQAVAEPFLYYLKSVENAPYIRFTVPGCILFHSVYTNPLAFTVLGLYSLFWGEHCITPKVFYFVFVLVSM